METGPKPLSEIRAWEQVYRRQKAKDRAPAQRPKYQRAGRHGGALGKWVVCRILS